MNAVSRGCAGARCNAAVLPSRGFSIVGCVSEPSFHAPYGWNKDSATADSASNGTHQGELSAEGRENSWSKRSDSQLTSQVVAADESTTETACRGAEFTFEFQRAGASTNTPAPGLTAASATQPTEVDVASNPSEQPRTPGPPIHSYNRNRPRRKIRLPLRRLRFLK